MVFEKWEVNGKKIKEIRKKKNYSQSDLAKAAGVTYAYISQIERGVRKNPSIKVLSKIANFLNVDLNEILINYDNELENQIMKIETLKFDSPQEALKFILQQPSFMAYGGYDLNQLSEEEIINLANDMLLAMRISLEKKKRQ